MPRLKSLDWFALLNLVFFLAMCALVYKERFITYFGEGRIIEFFFYAFLLTLAIAGLWWQFRHIEISPWVLVAVEAGILMHFAGGFVNVDGKRLYDCHFLGLRYDKYVHMVNAFAIGILIQNLFSILKLDLKGLREVIVLLLVLGLGAMVEIAEYIVTTQIPDNGVGNYDNNMQDLIFNACGGVICLICTKIARRKQ